jgi:hypothetical protein
MSSNRGVLGWVLCLGLAAAGFVNLVPGAHPDGAAHRAEVAEHISDRARPFIHRDSNDLADLALVHGRTVRVRYGPYLWLGELHRGGPLVTWPGSLIGEEEPAGRVVPEGAPTGVLNRQRILGLARLQPTVEDYDPVLDDATAADLADRAGFRGLLADDHELVVVSGAGPVTGSRAMVHDATVFVVDETTLSQVRGER